MKKQYGMSILECMLAIAFATALIWQVFIIYKDVRHTHQLQASMSHLLHHGQWLEDVMGGRIRKAGDMQCLPKSRQEAMQSQTIEAYTADILPARWSIHPAAKTEVLILGQCQKADESDNKMQWIQTAYYLQKNSHNNLYTLYQKQQGKRAMAMQDDIESLQWFLAYQTPKKGALTAPQEIGVQDVHAIGAVSWKVVFSSPNNILTQLKQPLTRIFYGYMSLHPSL